MKFRIIIALVLVMLIGLCSTVEGQTTYNAALHTVVNKPMGFSQSGPTDARSYYYDAALFRYRPYQSTAEVLSYLNLSKYRDGNFPIYINSTGTLVNGVFIGGTVEDYTFRNGNADDNLVKSVTYPVTTVFTRSGAVIAQSGDYNSDQVTEGSTHLYSTSTRIDARITLQKAAANGIASLDGSGKIPLGQLPSGSQVYKGTWNVASNSPPLVDGTGTAGDTYRVITGGTRNLGSGNITWTQGDDAIYNGSVWQRNPAATSAVSSVNSQIGAVTLTTTDITEGTNKYFNGKTTTDLPEGTNLYFNGKTTTDLPEGTNQYYTLTRSRSGFSASNGISYNSTTGAFTLNNTAATAGVYSYPSFTLNATGQVTAITSNTPVTTFNGRSSAVVPGNSDYTTTMVAEGTNQYFTNTRARAALSAGGSLSYNSATGVFSYTQPSNVSAFVNDSRYFVLPAGTVNDMLRGDGTVTNFSTAVNAVIPPCLSTLSYVLTAQSGNVSPADAVTSWYGTNSTISGSTTEGLNKVRIPNSGVITKILVNFNNSGVGSGEASSFYLRVNNTTDYLLSNIVVNNAATYEKAITNLSIPVTGDWTDYIEFKWVHPTWVTNPTNVRVTITIYIEQN